MQIVLENEEACDSHYLPKSVYRAALAKELKNPNAVVIANGQCKQVSDQLRGPVFCAYSEQKLNKNGETWVMARTPHRHEEIFLQKALLAIERSAFQDRLDIYQVRGKEGLDSRSAIPQEIQPYFCNPIAVLRFVQKRRADFGAEFTFGLPTIRPDTRLASQKPVYGPATKGQQILRSILMNRIEVVVLEGSPAS